VLRPEIETNRGYLGRLLEPTHSLCDWGTLRPRRWTLRYAGLRDVMSLLGSVQVSGYSMGGHGDSDRFRT
jgi:hypothetical protein